MASCRLKPEIGQNTFNELEKQLGGKMATEVFLRAISPRFKNDFKDTLSLDSEGVPTYDSIMKNSYMRDFIGEQKMTSIMEKQYKSVPDTAENYSMMLEQAKNFNETSQHKDGYVAYVDYTEDNKLKLKVSKKTKESVDRFANQYSTDMLNRKLVKILEPLGITIGHLTEAEVSAGRVGHIDFSKASGIAADLSTLIRVANNKEGAESIGEECAHLLVRVFKNHPLVKRSLEALMNDETSLKEVLGDEYQDTLEYHNQDMSKVAEEALGKILQQNLKKEATSKKAPSQGLFRRLLDYIVNQFRRLSSNDIDNAIIDANVRMGTLAKNILKEDIKLTDDQIRSTYSEDDFNALSDRIERNIKILTKARDVQLKRYKIAKEADPEVAKKELEGIEKYMDTSADTVEGIFNYALNALNELKGINREFAEYHKKTPGEKFRFLRKVKLYITSYGSFIENMNNAIIEEEQLVLEDTSETDQFARTFKVGDEEIALKPIIEQLVSLQNSINSRFLKHGFTAFAEFLKPFLGDSVTMKIGKAIPETITIEEALKKASKDISFMSRWLDALGDSSDIILQGFNAAVLKKKNEARMKAIDFIKGNQALMLEAEQLGISNFEWLFEVDSEGNKSGDYVNEINQAEYDLAKKKFFKYLEEKYGTNPTGKLAEEYLKERDAWLEENALNKYSPNSPNPVKYRNKEFLKLTDNQLYIRKKFLERKEMLDKLYPPERVYTYKAIQMRKTQSQRLLDSLSSPSKIWENIKENMKETFLDTQDDDQLFGDVSKGISDFEGREFMTLPVLYTNRLSNANELTTDVFASLNAYTCAAFQYQAIDSIIDPLEVGRSIIREKRDTQSTRGSNIVEEQLNVLGRSIKSKVNQQGSPNWMSRLDDFFSSQVYMRYMKDHGSFDLPGTKEKINTSKTINWLMRVTSLAKLGLNFLAQTANATTGIAMTNIEAAAGEFFNPRDLLKADGTYTKELIPFLSELGSRIKTNKLALFDELINLKKEFGGNQKRVQIKNLLQRLGGATIAYIGQEAGDHWLYNRVAIAMAHKTQVKVPSGSGTYKTMSLWDALQIVDIEKGNNKIKKMILPEGTIGEDGKPFDIAQFGDVVNHVNDELFGIYDEQDANAANQVALGRLLMQMRKWMRPSFNKRFRKTRYIQVLGREQEGYYYTVYRLMNELVRSKFQISATFKNLSKHEKANLRRAGFEVLQFLAVLALLGILDFDDDKERDWTAKMAEYLLRRSEHELGGLVPSGTMLKENLKTLTTPMMALSTLSDAINLLQSIYTPADYMDELQSGPYKGMSTFEKHLIKAPLPIVAQMRQIDRFTGDLDTSIAFYTRPY